MRSWAQVWAAWKRAYDLDDHRPSQVSLTEYGGIPMYCHRCEHLSSGGAWEPQTREFLCTDCYERSEYAHRQFRWA